MKVRIYKAPDGKGKLVKAKGGMAVNTDKEIKKKIAEGKDPEIIIYEMAEFGLSRDQARDKVYKLYDLLGDDEYDEDEPTAPYDQPVEDEVAEAVVEEEEPDNAAIYDYYGGDNQGLDVVNDGADDEDEDMARYGGQYAEGGQFAPGSIIPKPKKPYYIGMDAEPYDNAYKFGGLTKGAYVKKRIKELRKAAQGEEVKNNETNISPRGTIDSPAGFTSPEKNLASVIKQNANEAVLKQQAENEYQQYQNSTMGQDFNGKFLFGGRNRKIRRANRAMFGTPTAIPGVDVNYEFGPLGGLRKAEANWDLDAIGDLAKLLPGAMNMMPGMFPGMMPGMMSYKKVSYPAQVRKKTITTINNAALDEIAKQNPNSTAAQNNRSDKKNEIKCPPGSVYDSSLGHCVDQEGNRVRSIVDLPDPEELLGNPFENPNARMLNGKKTMKATGPSSKNEPIISDQSTWTTEQEKQAVLNAADQNAGIIRDFQNEDPFGIGYEHGGFVDAANMDPNTLAKFIYGGDEYAYGGDVLHKAYDGYITNFQKQMDATKSRIDQMGNKNPADVNPFRGNAFGKATTGIQPSGTVGNRFQPSGQPNTGTTTQGGIGTSGGGRGIMSPERAAELSRMTPEQQKAEAEKGKKDFDNWFNNSVQQEYGPLMGDTRDPNGAAKYAQFMQMMQGQPGMGQFSVGRPQRLGFGLTRDFNYSSGFSPVNWQVPEGTKGIKQTAYKDRGKWYNPFDTKRITEWRIDNGEAIPTDPSKTGTQDGAGEDETETTGKRFAKGMKIGKDEMLMTNVDAEGNPMGIDSKGRLVNADADVETPAPDKMPTRGASQIPTSVSGPAPETIQTQGETAVSSSNPFAGNAFSGNQFGSASTGVQPSGDLKSAQSPNDFTMTGQSNVSSNPFTGNAFSGNAFGNANMGVSGNVSNSPSATPGANNMTSNTNVAGSEGAQENNQTGASQNNLSEREQSEMDYIMQNRRSSPASFQPVSGQNLKPSELLMQDLSQRGDLTTPDRMNTLPPSQLEQKIDPESQVRNFQQYSGPFEGSESNDQMGLFGTMNDMSEGTIRNREIQAKQTWDAKQRQIAEQQKQAALQKQNTASPNSGGAGYNMSGSGIKEISSRVTDKNDLGNRGLVAAGNVYKMWENEPNKKQYGSFENWAKQKGYGNLVNREGGEIDYMAYGGYIPEYMAYGGYIPMAKSGITAGKPEFEDPNLIGRTVEQSAYTFNPGQFATDLFSGPTSLTGLTTNILNARDEARKMDQAAQRNRTSDAATANTGQSGFGSAERKGSDLMATGNETQYGSTPGKQGYEGGLYGKKGGSMNTQYAKGKVYSLTMDQIKAIEAAGGKVEYIK